MNTFIGIFKQQLDFIEQVSFPFALAFIISICLIPLIIFLSNKYQLHDKPDLRKIHAVPVPTFGGIAIFLGGICATLINNPEISSIQVILLLTIVLVFVMGVHDDVLNMRASHKLLVESLIGLLIAACGIRIHSLYGLFGIHELPVVLQYVFTVCTVAGITNAINLIDGIDGLAAGLCSISLVTGSYILWQMGDPFFVLLMVSFAGALVAFLLFNRHPAKIFMGDTGSLTLGLLLSIMVIRIMQNPGGTSPTFHIPITAVSLVLIPVFDTLRVFSLRLLKGQSPFVADRNHIHHLLTNAGFPHDRVCRAICGVHILNLLIAYSLPWLEAEILLATITGLVLCVTLVFKLVSEKRLGMTGTEVNKLH